MLLYTLHLYFHSYLCGCLGFLCFVVVLWNAPFQCLHSLENIKKSLFFRFPRDLQYLCKHGPQLPSPSLSSILIGKKGPGQNNFDLTLPLNHPASSLPINNKSPNDSKRLLAVDINGGGKNQDNISTFHPVHRNNDEYERNGNNIANSNVDIAVSNWEMNLELFYILGTSNYIIPKSNRHYKLMVLRE